MRRTVFWLLGILGLVAAAVAVLWLLERRRVHRTVDPQEGAPQDGARMLVAFSPARVSRVRLQRHGQWVDRSRTAVGWSQTKGRVDQGTPLQVEAVLRRLAQLRGRRVSLDRRRLTDRAQGRVALWVRIWMKSRRSIGIAFYRRGGRVLVTTSRRKGVFRVSGETLAWLVRGLGGTSAHARALPAREDHLGAVFVEGEDARVRLRKRAGRWFVTQGATWVPADADRVSALLRGLLALRETHLFGKGAAAARRHPVSKPNLRVVVDDGHEWTLTLGGACPRHPGSRLAHRAPDGVVFCVTPLDPKLLRGPFQSTRLFFLSPDEVRSIEVVRGRLRLDLEYRPGKGGWVVRRGAGRSVDPDAAVRLVTTLAGLRAVEQRAQRPVALRPVGRLGLSPRTGKPTAVTLWSAPGSDVVWASRGSGGPWMRLPSRTAWALGATGLSLRSLRLCSGDPSQVVGLYRTGIGGYSEWFRSDRGAWQILLLKGAPSAQRARQIGGHVGGYRSVRPGGRGRVARVSWKPPVAGLLAVDSGLRSSLFHRVTHLRAERMVASRARPQHGFGGAPVRLTLWHRHDCREVDGHRRCQIGECRVEVGVGSPKTPGCFARRVGEAAVFELPRSACSILRRPVASRLVTAMSLGQLDHVTLSAGRRSLVFRRGSDGLWRSKGQGGPLGGNVGVGLLFLAPLRAQTAASYGPPPRTGRVLLRAALKARTLPPMRLTFYAPRRPGGAVRVTVPGRPVRYFVRAGPVHRLRRWAEGRFGAKTPPDGE